MPPCGRTSNKGSCGAFNANVVKRVRSLLAGPFASAQVDIATIGSKGRELLSRYCTVSADYSAVYDNLTYAATAQIAQKIMDDFAAGVYDRVEIVYNRFKNAATQVLTREEFLPMTLQTNAETAAAHTDFILEPDSRSIVENLLPQSLRLQFFRILRDSLASEHGARMTAMSQASDNAKELKEQLTLQYNNARQASITNQIIEIVSAAKPWPASKPVCLSFRRETRGGKKGQRERAEPKREREGRRRNGREKEEPE